MSHPSDANPATSQAFVLWIDTGRSGEFAGAVEHVGSATRQSFTGLAELGAFIERTLAPGKLDAPSDLERRGEKS